MDDFEICYITKLLTIAYKILYTCLLHGPHFFLLRNGHIFLPSSRSLNVFDKINRFKQNRIGRKFRTH